MQFELVHVKLSKCTLHIFTFINNFWFTLIFLHTARTLCLHINRTLCLYAASTLCLYADGTLCLRCQDCCLHASRTVCMYTDRTFHPLTIRTLLQASSVQRCSFHLDFFQFFVRGMPVYLIREEKTFISVWVIHHLTIQMHKEPSYEWPTPSNL